MSNLATMIMEGSMGVSGNIKHEYGHEGGAALIAMESAEALRDIFEAEFYVPNTCTITAAMEGASCVEESSQAAIMEASIRDAFQKIKEFLIKLKNKVMNFLHNIKRYLLGIFGNDKKWVENYADDLKNLSAESLKGYEVKMYTYTLGEAIALSDYVTDTKKVVLKNFDDLTGVDERDDDSFNDQMDGIYSEFIESLVDHKVSEDEYSKAVWSKFRDGAINETDKKDVAVGSNIQKFIDAIKSSTKDVESFNKTITDTDKAYKDAIKFVDNARNKVEDAPKNKNNTYNLNKEDMIGSKDYAAGNITSEKKRQNYLKYLRAFSSTISKMQTAHNTFNTARKTALEERNKAYKKALVGAFGYARKHNKKNK